MTKLVLKPKSFEKEKFSMLLNFWENTDSMEDNSNDEQNNINDEGAGNEISSESDYHVEQTADLKIGGSEERFQTSVTEGISEGQIHRPVIILSTPRVVIDESSSVQSVQINKRKFNMDEIPSFNLGVSQNTPPSDHVSSVIANVIDGLTDVQDNEMEDNRLQIITLPGMGPSQEADAFEMGHEEGGDSDQIVCDAGECMTAVITLTGKGRSEEADQFEMGQDEAVDVDEIDGNAGGCTTALITLPVLGLPHEGDDFEMGHDEAFDCGHRVTDEFETGKDEAVAADENVGDAGGCTTGLIILPMLGLPHEEDDFDKLHDEAVDSGHRVVDAECCTTPITGHELFVGNVSNLEREDGADVGASVGTDGEGAESNYVMEINRLKEEVAKVHGEKELISDTYLEEIRLKDVTIEELRTTNNNLKMQVKELSVPSPTQIYANPENIEKFKTIEELHITKKENLVLLQDNADLREKLKKYEDEEKVNAHENSDKTPARRRQKSVIDPSLLVLRMKKRKGNKAQKQTTPDLSTAAIINIDEQVESEGEDDVPLMHRFMKKMNEDLVATFKLDESKWAVRKTDSHIKFLIEERWGFGGEFFKAWEGLDQMSKVTVGNILSILHHERIASNVIDSWSEILQRKYAEVESVKYTMIFHANCLKFIVDNPTGNNGTLRSFVDEKLEKAVDMDVLVFPLITSGTSRSRRSIGDHWTLIKLNMRTGEWNFFNSLQPRTKFGADAHLNNALILVDYVEKRLNAVFKQNIPSHPFLKNATKKVVACDSLQQVEDSLDCGIIVCLHIENILLKRTSRKGEFSHISAGNYRKKMVEWCMDLLSVAV